MENDREGLLKAGIFYEIYVIRISCRMSQVTGIYWHTRGKSRETL